MRCVRLICIFAIFLLSAGCMPQSTFVLKIHSGALINPTQSGEALPVIVKIYQLSDDNPFLQAEFQELWKQDDRILSSSMVSKKEVQISPNNDVIVPIKQVDRARYLAIMATFLNTQGQYRDIIPVSKGIPGLNHTVLIEIQKNRIVFL